MTKLPRSFYLRPTVQVAKDLLGKHIVRVYKGAKLIGKIVETEAYCEGDPASHSFRGKTKRNEVMYWDGGHLYVYFTYGMHFCANVVTRTEGIGEAVLIRAVQPIEGIETMMKNRFPTHQITPPSADFANSAQQSPINQSPTNLTNGPAKFCEAFGIARKENGTDLLSADIYIVHGERMPPSKMSTSSRIGIRNGTEKKWRFFVKGNEWVSK